MRACVRACMLTVGVTVQTEYILCDKCINMYYNVETGQLQGGTLVEYNGKLRLLEIAQVPKEHVRL